MTSMFKRTALASTLAAVLFAGTTQAQSTVGEIHGSAAAAQTVQIHNIDTGATRTVTVGEDGRYRAASLPIGSYRVNVQKDGRTVSTREINVVAGQSSQVNFAADASDAYALDTVSVSANALAVIDIASVESRTSFTADQLNKLPVPRNVVDVAALTPGTVKGDGAFGNLPSFGGASVAENSYYVNGFNVTNLYNNLSFSEVPFQAIQQLDVQTGGYGAQYGFSTGGVTSVITKRGTNEWKGGASWVYTPAWGREQSPTTYTKDGNLYRTYRQNNENQNVYSAWLGGALVKDKLFFYGIFQADRKTETRYPVATSTAAAQRNTQSNPFYLVKMDWNLDDSNILEWTSMNNTQHTTNRYFGSSIDANGKPSTDDYLGRRHVKTGGATNIFKYTGYLTDDLTLSAQWGKMKSKNSSEYVNADGTVGRYDGNIDSAIAGCPYIIDRRASTLNGTTSPIRSCYLDSRMNRFDGEDQRTAYRVDLDWKIGDHSLAGGYSREKWTSEAGTAYAGGVLYSYNTNKRGEDYVQVVNFRNGGSVMVDQKSWYLQDNWQVTDNVLAYIGVRNDSFNNKNGDGRNFVRQGNIWQPRLGFSWDVFGDSATKVYGTAGRYSLPIAANVALRAATASYYTQQEFAYSAIDPVTGAPTLGDPLGEREIVNGESGVTPNPRSVAARNLKPYSQDEYILGFQHRIGSDNAFLDGWVVGAKATYRRLNNAIEDTCDWRPFYDYGKSIGLDMDTHGGSRFTPPQGTPGCFIYNPGSKVTLDVDLDGSGTLRKVTLPGTAFGQKAKRSYQALTLSAEKASEKLYVNASYTWSKNRGNMEGLVKSDNGQDDTGTTSAFDYPELMIGANGYLPNDRRHSFKVYGGYALTPEWSVGVNGLLESGRPTNCFGGGNGTVAGIPSYNSAFFYCEGKITSRGRGKRLPWTWTLSPNIVYTPAYARGLTMQLDVINAFNNSKPIAINEIAERGSDQTYYNTTYRVPTYFQTPRHVRLMVQYDFSL
ncbi:TonB-dependent receptor [Luteibacter yeojuensis]|uniref:TonB-dependent receptor n=1 Tax=Luteibacter yeojuensis TaxID=345309 RepID=A0A7X5QU84_9GAMM|nr:TonB-dependent receptor [Luteibacter yeojuensis]NID15503.1 TonB-dependent receptor [Luteibacter yeojuensis]